MNKTYLFWNGLKQVAKQVSGKEKIFMGIRPFGFHAGNELALLVYPWHLCNLVKKEGKLPEFEFFISINDMEPNGLKYLYNDANGKLFYKPQEFTLSEEVPFEYNVFPRTTSFQYTKCEEGCCKSIVDHWQKIIESKMNALKRDFPGIKLNFIRNSSIKNKPEFKKAIKTALKNPEILGKILAKYEKICFKKGFLNWIGAICPKCNSAQGKTILKKEKIIFKCKDCGKKTSIPLGKASYWMHYIFMLPPRLKIFKADFWISGYDHCETKNTEINEELYKELYGEETNLKTIFSPLVISLDGKKMSKTRENLSRINSKKLKKMAIGFNKHRLELKQLES